MYDQDEWLNNARRFIVPYECGCDCFICARGQHDEDDCPHGEASETERALVDPSFDSPGTSGVGTE